MKKKISSEHLNSPPLNRQKYEGNMFWSMTSLPDGKIWRGLLEVIVGPIIHRHQRSCYPHVSHFTNESGCNITHQAMQYCLVTGVKWCYWGQMMPLLTVTNDATLEPICWCQITDVFSYWNVFVCSIFFNKDIVHIFYGRQSPLCTLGQ